MTFIPCSECDGMGRAYYTVGRDWDGVPREALLTCETCEGAGEVPLICPECKAECDELLDAGFADYKWCLVCALESIEAYSDEQAQIIREKAAQVAP